MVKLIRKPTELKAHGNKPKIIEEFIGRVNSGTKAFSIARMNSPEGWSEPGRTVIVPKGEWVQYSTPHRGGARYIAVCLPAFSPAIVHRDGDQQ